MSDDDQGEKTEKPTEKKLTDARASGDVPTSKDLPLFGSLLASLLICSLLLRDSALKVADMLARLLDDPGHWTLQNGADAALLFNTVLQTVGGFMIPIFVVFIVAGLAINFAQNMPSFVLERIQPNFSKISPKAGLERMLGSTGIVELGKSIFKLVAIGLIIVVVLHSEQQTVTDSLFVEPTTIPDRMLSVLIRLLSGVATAFVVLAGIDFVWTRASWNKRMRMSRHEIKEEMKQAEGDPIAKAKRRSIALDRARRRMLANVHKATMVITNPTHLAIALRYVREEGGAPVVVAKGQDLIALKIREIAKENGIEIIENKPLARSMYDQVEVSQVIPPQFYKAVAEVIHYIQSRKTKKPSPRTP